MVRWAVGFYICGFDCCKHSGIYQAWSFYLAGVLFFCLFVFWNENLLHQYIYIYIYIRFSILLECFFCLFVFWNAKSYSSKKKKKKKTVKDLVLSLKQAVLSA